MNVDKAIRTWAARGTNILIVRDRSNSFTAVWHADDVSARPAAHAQTGGDTSVADIASVQVDPDRPDVVQLFNDEGQRVAALEATGIIVLDPTTRHDTTGIADAITSFIPGSALICVHSNDIVQICTDPEQPIDKDPFITLAPVEPGRRTDLHMQSWTVMPPPRVFATSR